MDSQASSGSRGQGRGQSYSGSPHSLAAILERHLQKPGTIKYSTLMASRTCREQILPHGPLLKELYELQPNLSFSQSTMEASLRLVAERRGWCRRSPNGLEQFCSTIASRLRVMSRHVAQSVIKESKWAMNMVGAGPTPSAAPPSAAASVSDSEAEHGATPTAAAPLPDQVAAEGGGADGGSADSLPNQVAAEGGADGGRADLDSLPNQVAAEGGAEFSNTADTLPDADHITSIATQRSEAGSSASSSSSSSSDTGLDSADDEAQNSNMEGANFDNQIDEEQNSKMEPNFDDQIDEEQYLTIMEAVIDEKDEQNSKMEANFDKKDEEQYWKIMEAVIDEKDEELNSKMEATIDEKDDEEQKSKIMEAVIDEKDDEQQSLKMEATVNEKDDIDEQQSSKMEATIDEKDDEQQSSRKRRRRKQSEGFKKTKKAKSKRCHAVVDGDPSMLETQALLDEELENAQPRSPLQAWLHADCIDRPTSNHQFLEGIGRGQLKLS